MFLLKLKNKYTEARKLALKKKKKLAFIIGNTIKIEKGNYYFTPPRVTGKLVIFGMIVFKESIVIDACKYLDGKVDIIFAFLIIIIMDEVILFIEVLIKILPNWF